MSLTGDLPSRDVPRRSGGELWNEAVHRTITARKDALAERTMELHFERDPGLKASYSPRQKAFYLEDTGYNLESLSAAILFETPQIFLDYVVWLVELLEARHIPTGGLGLHFACLRDALHETLPGEVATQVDSYIEAGVQQLQKLHSREDSSG